MKNYLLKTASVLTLLTANVALGYFIYNQTENFKSFDSTNRVQAREIKLLNEKIGELEKNQSKLKNTQAQSGEAEREYFEVLEVIDGDSFKVKIAGKIEEIRLLGINTPEIAPYDECFGEEAKNFSTELLTGKKVYLLEDLANTDRDVYGRLLRYAYFPDSTQINSLLIEEGYAVTYSNFPIAYLNLYKKLQQQAEEDQKGLWKSC